MVCLLFWEAVKNQSHSKHKLALAAVQNIRISTCRTKKQLVVNYQQRPVKAVTQVRDAAGTETKKVGINYEKAAAEAINRVKQDLATKEIEKRLKQEMERQTTNETL